MAEDDVADLAGGLRAHNAFGRDDLACEGRLCLVRVHWDLRLVPKRIRLKPVLLLCAWGLVEEALHSAGDPRDVRTDTHTMAADKLVTDDEHADTDGTRMGPPWRTKPRWYEFALCMARPGLVRGPRMMASLV